HRALGAPRTARTGANSAGTAGPWACPDPSGIPTHYLRGSAYSTLLSIPLALRERVRVRGFPKYSRGPSPLPSPQGEGAKTAGVENCQMRVDVVLYPLGKGHCAPRSRRGAVARHIVKDLH